eukprot:SAG31_NODE_30_length_32545_cov_9.378999_6_plen_49_part_00
MACRPGSDSALSIARGSSHLQNDSSHENHSKSEMDHTEVLILHLPYLT